MGKLITSKKEQVAVGTQVAATLTDKPIGDLIDGMFALRERKRELEAQIKEIEGEYDGLSNTLLEKFEAEHATASRGSKATASVTTSVTGNIVEFDDLCKFVKRTGYFHLFERRISATAYRELLDSGKKVPGVETFVKKRVNLRAL